MPRIKVDSDVFVFLEEHAIPFVDRSPNDVLRRLLLGGPEDGSPAKSAAMTKPGGRARTGAFVQEVLSTRFGGGFRKRTGYHYMYESRDKLVYFQNFNQSDPHHLWYRLRATALRDLGASAKETTICLTNPADRILYALPGKEVITRALARGCSDANLEVNIDPSDQVWRELNWNLSRYLERY